MTNEHPSTASPTSSGSGTRSEDPFLKAQAQDQGRGRLMTMTRIGIMGYVVIVGTGLILPSLMTEPAWLRYTLMACIGLPVVACLLLLAVRTTVDVVRDRRANRQLYMIPSIRITATRLSTPQTAIQLMPEREDGDAR